MKQMIGRNIKPSGKRFSVWKRRIFELRTELKEAESAFTSDPAGKDLKVKVDGIKKKLKEIERKLDESLSMYR